MVTVSSAAAFRPYREARWGRYAVVPAFTRVWGGSETDMDPMVLSGGFTAWSPLLPMCYKPLTAFTYAMRPM